MEAALRGRDMTASSADFTTEVRSYELDAYGHVNNSVYQQWFEEGRERVLRNGGVDYDYFPRELGVQFVLVRTEMPTWAAFPFHEFPSHSSNSLKLHSPFSRRFKPSRIE